MVLAATLLLGACGTTATPLGVRWVRATVERPAGLVPQPMPSSYRHPGHFTGQAVVTAVARGAETWVAVGYDGPPWRAAVWTSMDGRDWRLADPGASDGTLMTALAADPARGGLLAGGRDGREGALWASGDGRSWRRVDARAFHEGAPTRVEALLPTGEGWLAAGSAGPDVGRREARIWWSPDGSSWSRAALPLGTGADARVTGLAVLGARLVAVGWRGSEREPVGPAAWVSDDGGASWRAVPSPGGSADRGRMVDVTAIRDGLVAVGTDVDEREAAVWRSSDGSAWERIRSPVFAYHDQKVRMTAVASDPATGRLVAVGNYLFGTQYGFARAWTSEDGRSWSLAQEDATFGQGEMLAVALADGRAVAVGSFGAPDAYLPTIWVSPPR